MAKDLFNDILYSSPIYRDNRTDNQFTLELSKLKKEYPQTTPKYEIDFKKPLTPIRKYYHKLISNETINIFNQISIDTKRIDIPEEHSFLFLKHQKQVLSYLKNISSYISERQLLDAYYLNPSNYQISDEAYIIFYLKANAIMLYLELQERFSILENIETLSQEQIHEIYFNEMPPNNLLVQSINKSKIKIQKSSKVKASKTGIKKSFNFKYSNTEILLSVLKSIQLKIDLLNENLTTVKQFYEFLLTSDYSKIKHKIYLSCETTQFRYILDCFKPYFNNLNPTTVENSKCFYSKNGTLIKRSNLYKNKVHNTKEKDAIDKIFKQLQ